MAKRLNIKFIEKRFRDAGYILLEKTYKNVHQKLKFICPNGHKHSISWGNWQTGRRCFYCTGTVKPTINFIKSMFEKEGYKLLTKEYKNNRQKLEYVCPNNHHHSVSWNNRKDRMARCPYCYGNIKPTIEFIKNQFRKEGYKLLTGDYINCSQKLDYICTDGHKHSISWDSWKQGHRCPYCCGNSKLTIDFIRSQFKQDGYILLTTEYINNKHKLEYICPNNHKHNISWHKWEQGTRCPYCVRKASKWEKEVRWFLTSLCITYVCNDRTQLINPKTGCFLELDILMPQLNKAIECNGVYWHRNRKHYDLLKQKLCEQQGIDLLVLTDEEWYSDLRSCEDKVKTFCLYGG